LIRLGWPQLGAGAVFGIAVAVVLNPVTPALPDVTVPALAPSGYGLRVSGSEPLRQPGGAMPIAVPVVSDLASTATDVALPVPSSGWQPARPADGSVQENPVVPATGPGPAPTGPSPVIEVSTESREFLSTVPTSVPPDALPSRPGVREPGLSPHAGGSRPPLHGGVLRTPFLLEESGPSGSGSDGNSGTVRPVLPAESSEVPGADGGAGSGPAGSTPSMRAGQAGAAEPAAGGNGGAGGEGGTAV
jgi:hypothetical protein